MVTPGGGRPLPSPSDATVDSHTITTFECMCHQNTYEGQIEDKFVKC